MPLTSTSTAPSNRMVLGGCRAVLPAKRLVEQDDSVGKRAVDVGSGRGDSFPRLLLDHRIAQERPFRLSDYVRATRECKLFDFDQARWVRTYAS